MEPVADGDSTPDGSERINTEPLVGGRVRWSEIMNSILNDARVVMEKKQRKRSDGMKTVGSENMDETKRNLREARGMTMVGACCDTTNTKRVAEYVVKPKLK